MHLATDAARSAPAVAFPASDTPSNRDTLFAQYKVIRRNGAVVGFEPSKISIAVTKAFIAVNGGQGAASARVREVVAKLIDRRSGGEQRR